MLLSVLITCLLISFARSNPVAAPQLNTRAGNEVVQGKLATDEYWNNIDGGLNQYVMYAGNGSAAAGWPSRTNWISFNDMWAINQHVISRSCDVYYEVPNNSPDEIQALWNSIQQASHETRVDHRFILAAVLQETIGCVRAKTSVSPDGTVRNPGLLQSHEGSHSCNNNGNVQTPCPNDQILGMLMDGVGGTSKGQGFAGTINDQITVEGIEFAEAYYRGARLYNSGMIDKSGDLGKGTATHCYASDIANRLVGWVDAPTKCTLDK